MSKRMKEEERIERMIRGLLKLSDNKRCINCNSLGPQYVCTTFWTFVCTRCSGVHREFTHRVKSVSMARFNDEEVGALEAGGNQRAKEIYFKTWDPCRNAYPDPSNLHKLRDFIKHVYVDRKYTGERGRDKFPMMKPSIKDEYRDISSPGDGVSDRCSFDGYSPRRRRDDMNIRSYSNIEERTSPRYNHGRRSSRERSLPTRFEIIDDRFRDDKGSGDIKRYEYHIFTKSESRGRSSPPVSLNVTTPPKIKSIKEILGDKVVPLCVGESPKSSDNAADSEKITKEKESENVGSLIDLENDPRPELTTPQETAPPKETDNDSNPPSSVEKVPTTMNLLESLFIDMSTPAVASTENTAASEATSDTTVASCNTTQPAVASMESTLPLPGPNDSTEKATDGPHALPIKNQHSAVHVEITNSNIQQSNASFDVLYGQKSTSQPTGNAEAPATNALSLQTSPATSVTAPNDPSCIGRKELPADLFTSSYPPFAAAMPGWQFRPPAMMYGGMQYNLASMPISTPPNPARSRNPFDADQVQAPEFPSMLSMQTALPNLSAPINVQPQPMPYALAMHPQTASYGMAIPGGAYSGQQIPGNIPLIKPQGNNSFGKDDDSPFASLNPLQQSNNTNPVPASSNSFSSKGGNPFG